MDRVNEYRRNVEKVMHDAFARTRATFSAAQVSVLLRRIDELEAQLDVLQLNAREQFDNARKMRDANVALEMEKEALVEKDFRKRIEEWLKWHRYKLRQWIKLIGEERIP